MQFSVFSYNSLTRFISIDVFTLVLDLHRTPYHTEIQDPCQLWWGFLPHFDLTVGYVSLVITSLTYKLESIKMSTFSWVSGPLPHHPLSPLGTSMGSPTAPCEKELPNSDLREWYWVIGRWLRKVAGGPPSYSNG